MRNDVIHGWLVALSIIIPVLNEISLVETNLRHLTEFRARGGEIIVVDGGSGDGTDTAALALATRVLTAPKGRASQMNAGARAAKGDILIFLHIDTILPQGAETLIENALAQSGRLWGRFDIRIVPGTPLLDTVARMTNLRSRLTGIATGDQAIFVRRPTFFAVGGYPDIALMEDIALSRKLKRTSKPLCLDARVSTSARRWRAEGVLRTILLMWRLRLAYFFGADPQALAQRYGYAPRTR